VRIEREPELRGPPSLERDIEEEASEFDGDPEFSRSSEGKVLPAPS
jgi:hypothetical protein